jgi:hypothetical protein
MISLLGSLIGETVYGALLEFATILFLRSCSLSILSSASFFIGFGTMSSIPHPKHFLSTTKLTSDE